MIRCAKCGGVFTGTACENCKKDLRMPRLPQKSLQLVGNNNKKTSAKDYYILCPPLNPLKLSQDKVFRIGREATNDLAFPSHEVSRFHAEIRNEFDYFIIEDLTSSNGTFVNGLAVKRHILSDGDVISISSSHILNYKIVSQGEIPDFSIKFSETFRSVESADSVPKKMDASRKSDLQGSIGESGIFGVLQMLAQEGRVGCLKLMSEGQLGFIYLSEGMMTQCLCEGLVGEDAFYALAKWNTGRFTFLPNEAVSQNTINKDLEGMILEAARRMDEEYREE